MRSVRLLPIVIFAAVALLIFKGIGLVSSGSYVLVGTTEVHAAESATPAAAAPADATAAGAEPTITDSTPTLSDNAPTMNAPAPAKPAPKAAEAKPAAAANGAAAPAAAADPKAAEAAPKPAKKGSSSTDDTLTAVCAPGTTPPSLAAPATQVGSAAPVGANTTNPVAASVATDGPGGCTPMPADAVPMKIGADGHLSPMTGADGTSLTQDVILQRLGERRAELDKREEAINMRESLVAAAEKKMNDQAAQLKALQDQITALTDQKKSMEDDQFTGIIKIYEGMKPQEAASIFDGLDMNVLLRVAKAMDPRKMSPIVAKMSAARAQELTAQLAAGDTQVAASAAPAPAADPNALPQIVGH